MVIKFGALQEQSDLSCIKLILLMLIVNQQPMNTDCINMLNVVFQFQFQVIIPQKFTINFYNTQEDFHSVLWNICYMVWQDCWHLILHVRQGILDTFLEHTMSTTIPMLNLKKNAKQWQ